VKPNLLRAPGGEDGDLWVEVVTDTLVPYGLNPGTRCRVEPRKPPGPAVEVWELGAELHGRNLRPTGAGWYQAYTRFLTQGEICYSLSPDQMAQVVRRGWLPVPFPASLEA